MDYCQVQIISKVNNSRVVKRSMDIAGSLVALTLLFPLLLIICIIIFFRNSASPFFLQQRIGLHGKPFYVFKIITMDYIYNSDGDLLPDQDRITKLGRVLRSLSLDEVPQFFNVLIGDMSLVGPRPLLTEYMNYYTEEQARRHNMKPGITGWAQVNGRNMMSWAQQFEYDNWYIDHFSILLDIKILIMTLKIVIRREGIFSESGSTKDKFTGN